MMNANMQINESPVVMTRRGSRLRKSIVGCALAVIGFIGPGQVQAAVDLSGFAHVMSLSVTGYKGGTTLNGFPVLVRLSEGCARGFSYSLFKDEGGADLVFTDAAGTELPHEIDTWNPNGESLVWVKVPSVGGADAPILMYFGCDGSFGAETQPSDVWTSYSAVWHFGSSEADATGHGLQVAPFGDNVSAVADDGLLGAGYQNGAKSGLQLGNPTFTGAAVTLTCWFKPAAVPLDGVQRLISWKKDYLSDGCEVFLADGKFMLRGSTGMDGVTPNLPADWSTSWTHLTAIFNGKYAAGAVNGKIVKGDVSDTKVKFTPGSTFYFGNGYDSKYAFPGQMDELRVYNGRASDDWIAAENDTVADRCFVTLCPVRDPAETGDCYVSPTGNDANDGTTLVTAKKTLTAALEKLGEAGGVILVADGTYVKEETDGAASIYTLSAPVTVRGLSHDPTRVVFDRGPKEARLFKLDHADAKLQYLTVKDGGFETRCFSGGNVYVSDKGGTVEDCILTGGFVGKNKAPSSGDFGTGGGNIYLAAGLVSRCIVTNGLGHFDRQYATGIYAAGNSRVENSLIVGCRGVNGAGPGTVRLAGNAVMYNCTVVGNEATSYPALFFGSADTSCRVVNTVICNNRVTGEGGAATDCVYNLHGGNFVNCASDVAIAGGTDCFVPENFGFKADYSLRVSSELIDRGKTDDAVRAMASDLFGQVRVLGEEVDVGCSEYAAESGRVDAVFDVSGKEVLTVGGEAAVTFTPEVSGAVDYVCRWDFGDGFVEESTGATVHRYTTCGDYVPSLSVVVGGTVKATCTLEEPILVRPARLFVRAGVGSGTAPYDTEERATERLTDAIGWAISGSEIVVGAGEYASDECVINKGLRLVGETGNPEDAVVSLKSGLETRSLSVDAPGAFVAGLTFAGGRQKSGYGGGIYLTAGTVSNCVVRDSCVISDGKYLRGGGVYMSDGLLTHTRIERTGALCQGSVSGGANGLALHVEGGRVSNCLCTGDFTETAGDAVRTAGNFVYVSGGVLENCTFAGRKLRWDCSDDAHDKVLRVAEDGTAVNCVVTGFGFVALSGTVPEDASPVLVNEDHGALVNCYIGTDTGVFRNFGQGDYRPAWGGALNDKGTLDGLVSVPSVDLLGKPRVLGSAIDIGAYESKVSGLILLFR